MKKIIATSLVINFLGLNLSLAADKPLPMLPNVAPEIEQLTDTPIKNGEKSVMVQPDSRYLKAGEDLTVEILENINSASARPGDIITAKLLLPVDLNGKIVIPEGSLVIGKITQLQKITSTGKDAKIKIHFKEIRVGRNYRIPISGIIKTVDNTGILTGGNYKKQLQESIAMGATTTAGGAIAGLGLGLLSSAAAVGSCVGLVVGGVLGFGWLFFKQGKPIQVPAGTNLLVNLEYDVAITDIGL